MTLDEHFSDKNRMTVAWFGGSITEGCAASRYEKSYSGLTTEFLRERYPQTEITELRAAIGGTGSDLGAYRADQDLVRYEPDIVFLEYAVNDFGRDAGLCERAYEGIIRKLLRRNPETLIVSVFTVQTEMIEKYIAKGLTPDTVAAQTRISKYYGIPCVDVGKALYDKLTSEKLPTTELLSDGVHPNDAGHAFYAETLTSALIKLDFSERPMLPLKLPLREDNLERAAMLTPEEFCHDGWLTSDETLFGRMKNFVFSETPGDTVTAKFAGRTASLYWSVTGDSGDIWWRVDGGEWERASSWDRFALQFDRVCYWMLAWELPEGEHTLELRVAEEKNEQSKGRMIRISAVLCEKI